MAKGMEHSNGLPGRRGSASILSAGKDAVNLAHLPPRVLDESESKITVVYGDDVVLRIPVRSGGNDAGADIGDFLTRHGSTHVADVVGRLAYDSGAGHETVLGLLQRFVAGSVSLWQEAVQEFDAYTADVAETGSRSRLSTADGLGRSLGEIHALLASDSADPVFAPEPFDGFYRRSLYSPLAPMSAGCSAC